VGSVGSTVSPNTNNININNMADLEVTDEIISADLAAAAAADAADATDQAGAAGTASPSPSELETVLSGTESGNETEGMTEEELELAAIRQELAEYPDLARHERNRAARPSRASADASKRRRLSAGSSKTTCKVTPAARVIKYGAPFVVLNGKFFCGACKMNVQTKDSIIVRHIGSARHKQAKEKCVTVKKEEEGIRQTLIDFYVDNPTAEGCNVQEAANIFRYRVVRHFSAAGVALERLPFLRDVMSEAGHIPDAQNVKHFVPSIIII
jgi:hypothetical protein